MVNRIKYFLLFIGLALSFMVSAQDIPERPSPPKLVNDFAGILNSDEIATLEQKLVLFNDSTSTQIAVVIVKSLNGYDKADFAYRIGEKWGVGQKGKNNGAVLLVKPKIGNERGEVFIATGYGLEATLTDAMSRRIIENEMIPEFRKNNYYSGIDRGVDAIIKVTKGEYKADTKKDEGGWGSVLFIFIIIIIIISIIGKRGNRNNHTMGRRSSSIPWWLLLMGSGSSSGRSSGWGGSSGGSGGFGGFGGGSFGGGGAGGSW